MLFDPMVPARLMPIPPEGLNLKDQDFSDALIKAHRALGELKGHSFAMPNPLLLLSPAVLRESLASSEVENIHTTLVDVLKNQLFPEDEQTEDDKEVLRYREAILWGFEELKNVALSTRLISGIESRLVPSTKGEYRKQQNAIASKETREVLYTPPLATEVAGLMNNWEQFVNTTENIDPLVKAAIAHYQFEAIHPFDDGNGRTGRILMVLGLVQDDILRWPILFISGYILQRRTQYYRLLRDVTKHGSWKEFILFMLEGFYLQATDTDKLLCQVMALFEHTKSKVKAMDKKIYSAEELIELLFSYPVVIPAKLARLLNIHYTTATRYLEVLQTSGVLVEQRVGKYRYFINKKLIDLVTYR